VCPKRVGDDARLSENISVIVEQKNKKVILMLEDNKK
jgi:hypothetical protein